MRVLRAPMALRLLGMMMTFTIKARRAMALPYYLKPMCLAPSSMQRLYVVLVVVVLLRSSAVSGLHHTIFCVITSDRRTSYLTEVTDSLRDAMRMDGVGVIVVSTDGRTRPTPHTGFVTLDPRRLAVCDTPDVEGVPSCKVRQITLDVTGGLSVCAKHTSGWVVLLEDDCVACEGAVDETVAVLSGLNATELSFARFSKGLRGIAFPALKVARFAEYAVSRLYTHPHDITKMEEWDPPGRMHVHARNLFHHIGLVSTDDRKNTDEFRQRYAAYRDDVCFETTLVF
jgi:hypothetical protein